MARSEAPIQSFMLTQSLEKEHWNWSDEELKFIEEENIREIGRAIMKRFYCVDKTAVEAFYIILHDKDTRQVWNKNTGDYALELKLKHVHVIGRFKKGKAMLLNDIATVSGVAPEHIEKPKRGRDSYNNMLSYLIHIKDVEKHQYDPEEVITIMGQDYQEIFAENREKWLKGRAKKTAKTAKMGAEELEALILDGSVTKKQVILSDNYYQIYARESVRMDKAFDVYAERKIYKTIEAMDRGDFHLTVIFIEGKSRSGKSFFTDLLSNSLIEAVKNEKWSSMRTAPSNPFDEYLGEEIIKMDDLRGVAMTASDWLQLMDPERAGTASARYKNKKVAPRVILINSEKTPADFFFTMKNSVGQLTEAMYQFFARILKLVRIVRFEDDSRYATIATSQRVQRYELPDPRDRGLPREQWRYPVSELNFNFVSDKPQNELFTFSGAVEALTRVVYQRNTLKNNNFELEEKKMYTTVKKLDGKQYLIHDTDENWEKENLPF